MASPSSPQGECAGEGRRREVGREEIGGKKEEEELRGLWVKEERDLC